MNSLPIGETFHEMKSVSSQRVMDYLIRNSQCNLVVIMHWEDAADHTKDFSSMDLVMESLKRSHQSTVFPHVFHTSSSSSSIESPKLDLHDFILPGDMILERRSISLTELLNEVSMRSPEVITDKSKASSSRVIVDVSLSSLSGDNDYEELHRVLAMKHISTLFILMDAGPLQQQQKQSIEFGHYDRILSTDTTDGDYYLPEGSEYSIYYADTYLYLTPDIFTGLLTSIFMAFVVLVGLSCMGSIQGMSSFYDKIPAVGREA
jgi:hypothetical protein